MNKFNPQKQAVVQKTMLPKLSTTERMGIAEQNLDFIMSVIHYLLETITFPVKEYDKVSLIIHNDDTKTVWVSADGIFECSPYKNPEVEKEENSDIQVSENPSSE